MSKLDDVSTPTSGSQLCVSCGLCCDGTIFERVPVLDDDDPSHLRQRGVRFDAKDEYWLLPCAALEGRTCSIYSCRLGVCRTYRCPLLERHENGEIPLAEALKIVARTVALKTSVRAAFTAVDDEEEVAFRQLYLREISGVPVLPNNARILLDFAVLQISLDRYFRRKVEVAFMESRLRKA